MNENRGLFGRAQTSDVCAAFANNVSCTGVVVDLDSLFCSSRSRSRADHWPVLFVYLCLNFMMHLPLTACVVTLPSAVLNTIDWGALVSERKTPGSFRIGDCELIIFVALGTITMSNTSLVCYCVD